MEFTVATANLLHETAGHHAYAAKADAHKVFTVADLAGFQEARDWLDVLRGFDGWSVFADGPHPARQTPVAWRTALFELLDGRVTLGCEAGDYHGHLPPARYITEVTLRHKPTGLTVVLLNTHLNSSIEDMHHPGRPKHIPRVKAAERHLAVLHDRVAHYRGQGHLVFVTGDFNQDHDADQAHKAPGFGVVDVLGDLVTFDMADGGSLGRRLVDHVGHTPDPRVTPTDAAFLRRTHSDHDFVTVAYELQEAQVPTGFMPGAIHKPIAPGANDPRIFPVGCVFHVAVSHAKSLHDYFDGPSGGIESHFYVRADGTIEQYRSIFYEADAEAAGNSWLRGGQRFGYVSVETEGMGEGEWTPAQLASLKRITLWVHGQSKFPLRVAPAWNSPGVGYHAQYEEWNPHAHSCPGPDRIRQFHQIIAPWLGANPEEDDVAWDTQIDKWQPGDKDPKDHMRAGQQLNQARGYADAAYQNTRKILRLLTDGIDTDALAEKVAGKINASLHADAGVVKQAVKDALAEGVE